MCVTAYKRWCVRASGYMPRHVKRRNTLPHATQYANVYRHTHARRYFCIQTNLHRCSYGHPARTSTQGSRAGTTACSMTRIASSTVHKTPSVLVNRSALSSLKIPSGTITPNPKRKIQVNLFKKIPCRTWDQRGGHGGLVINHGALRLYHQPSTVDIYNEHAPLMHTERPMLLDTSGISCPTMMGYATAQPKQLNATRASTRMVPTLPPNVFCATAP